MSNTCDGNLCTMTLEFFRNFETKSAAEDVQLSTENNQGFDAFGTFTRIDSVGGARRRQVSDPVTVTLISQPLIDLVALPDGVEDLYPSDPEKYETPHKLWW